MAEAQPLIDYYAVLNLPHRADLAGIENAYARVSDELVKRSEIDDTCHDALLKVNEAYAVLSKPELRRAYDQEFFHDELEEAARRARSEFRRQQLMSRMLVGALSVIVAVQAGVLVYLGRDEIVSFAGAVAALVS